MQLVSSKRLLSIWPNAAVASVVTHTLNIFAMQKSLKPTCIEPYKSCVRIVANATLVAKGTFFENLKRTFFFQISQKVE